MKIKGIPGEFAFRALVLDITSWDLSTKYFLTKEEVAEKYGEGHFKWPVRVDADGDCYVIDPSEFEEESKND